MDRQLRDFFDQQLEWVMARVPARVHELLRDVTMYVEDYPSPSIMKQMGVRRRDGLCGLYSGIPLTQRHVEISGVLSDAIYIYREGILQMATNRSGAIDRDELRRQIRITVLHELGHHHGLDEQALEELGY
jgi:predicted Zn-dependent protease with MMP-like domain